MNSEGCSILPSLNIAFQNGNPSQSEWANQVWLHMRHVCLGIYHESATLLCGHSACMRCLGELFKKFGNESECPCAGNRFLKVLDEIWRWIYHWGVWWNRCLFPYEWLADLDAISERAPRFSICTIRDVLAHGRWLDECIKRPSPPQRTCRPKNTG